MTAADLNEGFALFGLNDDEIFTSIATSGRAEPVPPPAITLQAAPVAAAAAGAKSDGEAVTETMMEAIAKAMMRAYRQDAAAAQKKQ